MNDLINDWSYRVLNAAFQGGLALGAALIIVSYVPRLSALGKVWALRIGLAKMLLASLVPVYVVLAFLPKAKSGHYFTSVFYPAFDLLLPFAFGLWLLSVGMGLWRHFRSRRKLSALVHDADQIEDRQVLTVYKAVCHRFDIGKAPVLLAHWAIPSPVLIKNGTTSIVLPAALLSDPDTGRLEIALAHELAHYRRHDLRWAWLPAIIDLLFFFHPFVPAALRKLRLAEEYAADELAMRITKSGPSTYSKTLLSFAETSIGLPGAYAMADTARELDRRIKQIYSSQKPRSRRQIVVAVIALGVGASALWPWTIATKQSVEAYPPSAIPAAAKILR